MSMILIMITTVVGVVDVVIMITTLVGVVGLDPTALWRSNIMQRPVFSFPVFWWASGGLDPTALLAKQYYAKARFSFFSGEHGTDGTVERQYYTTPAFSSMV